MSMNQFPLDPAGLPARFLEASPAEFGGKQQDRDGVAVWNVSLLVQLPGQRPDTLVVKVAGARPPEFEELAAVRLIHPVATYWQQGDRSGVSVRADGIELAAAGAIPAGPGDKAKPAA